MRNRLPDLSVMAVMARLSRDQRGVTVIVTGFALVLLMGFAGLAIDVAAWMSASDKMQAVADRAAHSAAAAAGG